MQQKSKSGKEFLSPYLRFCAHGLLMSLLKQIKTEPMQCKKIEHTLQCIFNFSSTNFKTWLLSYLWPHISASQTQGRQNSHQNCYFKLLKTCSYIVWLANSLLLRENFTPTPWGEWECQFARGGNRLHSRMPSECDYLQSSRVYVDY